MPKKTPAARKTVAPISISRGETLDRIIFPASRKPMDRRDLHVALEPILRAWIRAAVTWDTLAIGDYRFVVFALDVAPETQLYVQLWSEPFEPVLWEVSSGRWNPPADEWLAGERAARIEAAGFTIGGNAENYHREVLVKTAADIAALAKAVVKIFYSAFDYRGTAPIVAKLVHEGRSETNETFDSMTPEDLAKVFQLLGFRTEELAEEDDQDGPTLLRCRKRGRDTVVELLDQVGEENLYGRLRFEAEVELPPDERERLLQDPAAPAGAEPFASVSVVHALSGGVTLDWLMHRIQEWDAVLTEDRRAARARKRRDKVAVRERHRPLNASPRNKHSARSVRQAKKAQL